MTHEQLHDFARRYTAAWCSQTPEAVAAFFAPAGSLTINDGTSSIGRAAIAAAAQAFMTAFPDLEVLMDDLRSTPAGIEYHWTLKGTTNGNQVHINGFERWHLNPEGLIQSSRGYFDAEEYDRQVSRKL